MNNQQISDKESLSSPTYHLSSESAFTAYPPSTRPQQIDADRSIAATITNNKNHHNHINTNTNHNDDDSKEYNHSESINNDITITILISYGLPQTAHRSPIIDQYKHQIIDYFKVNTINIQQFYNGTLNKSDFVSNTIKYIESATNTISGSSSSTLPTFDTNNSKTNELPRALKQLYTIMAMYQYSKNDGMESITGISSNLSKSEPKSSINTTES